MNKLPHILAALTLFINVNTFADSIENCADNKFINTSTTPHYSHSKCKKYLPDGKLSQKMIFEEAFGKIKFDKEFYNCIDTEHRKEQNDFIKKSLRNKLSNSLYENLYLRCKAVYE